jgi:hypothetical protein
LLPGCANSKRIKIDSIVPMIPDNAPKIKYNKPIYLWFVEKSHLSIQGFLPGFLNLSCIVLKRGINQ